jgi:hypothetical protein
MRSRTSLLRDDEVGRFRAAVPALRDPVGRLRVPPATYGVVGGMVALADAELLGLRAPLPTRAR